MSYREQMIFFTFCLLVHWGNSNDLTGLGSKSTVHHVRSGIVTMETVHAADKNVYIAYETNKEYRTAYSTFVTENKELNYSTARNGHLRLNCRLATLRIVRGFVLCQTKPEFHKPFSKIELAKINLKSKYINTRTLQQSRGKWLNDDIDIMVEENGIWILYQGYNDGILEKISINDLSSIKQIHIDSSYTNHHAIIVSSKLYIMSTSNGNLNIIKAIDTENTENKMSYKVILSENFPENSLIHYNPKLQQLFATVTKNKTYTYIYNVEYCQFPYPSSNNIDLSKINSTFIWTFIPFENAHYSDIIHSISTFFDIGDHNTLRHIGDILITCPCDKCLMPGMSNKLFCRLNTIRLLFVTFVKQKTNPSVFNTLQVQLDMLKRLERSQFRILLNEMKALKHMLTKEFLYLNRNMHSLQSKLGSYFLSLAEFDNRKYQSDIELIHNIFNELNTKQQIISPLIMTKLSTLIKQASDTNYVEISGQISNVLIACAAFVNPFSIFDVSGVLLEVRDRQAKLTKSVVDKIKLDVISKYFPRLKAIGDQLQSKIKAMADKFPNIRALVSKAMSENLSDKDLNQYSHAFLNEYNSYRPAFELSTINEYESILSEIIDELCRIIYSGSSLPAAITQGVLASEGACLATKLDVQNLMGLYRDTYDKQDSLFYALTSTVRATIARHNSLSLQNISGRIIERQFENSINYKMATLEIIVHSEVTILFLIHDACTLLEYKNGGVMPEYCNSVNHDPLAVLNNNVVISSRFDKDMCESDNIERYVYIPAQQQSTTTKMPQGTIDLTRLYRGYEVDFQISSKEWLIKHNWIFNAEKDKMIILQKFELFIPNNNTNSSVDVLSSTRYLSQNMIRPGGKVYDFSVTSIYQYNFRYRQGGEHCTSRNLLRTTPYEFRSCPKLPTICVLSEGKVKNPAAYPSIYSKFGIKLSFDGQVKEPKPKTNFFLMAYIKLCIVDPIIPQGKAKNSKSKLNLKRHNVQKLNRNHSNVCCGMINQYYDRMSNSQRCKPCPNGSTPTLGGYYCE